MSTRAALGDERAPAELDDASIPALVEEAMTSARDLASEELRLALAEADAQIASIGRALGLSFLAAMLAGGGLAWAGVALVLALELGAVGAGILGALGLVAAGLALWLCRRALPGLPFAKTRERMERRMDHVRQALR
jgi:hypothetical protein